MKLYIVDAFTDTMYKGNPAAVCLLDFTQSDIWMQKVANEMNLSETAFIFPTEEGYILRWFTPQAEVDLCGHATLASAHILWQEEICSNNVITFKTKSGDITAEKNNGWIQMDFPVEKASECVPPTELIEGLNGILFRYVGKNRMDYLVEVANEEVVRSLQPRFNILSNVDARGVIVTSKSDNQAYDFVSRCFYPALGVNEDPVTGSAHSCLGPYWGGKLNKNKLQAIQISERQGVLDLVLRGSRIIISGKAVTTLKGKLILQG